MWDSLGEQANGESQPQDRGLDVDQVWLGLHRIAINDSTSVRANVYAAIQFRIPGDVQDETPLMLIIIDPHPTSGDIVRSEDAAGAVNCADQVQCREIRAGSSFSESEGVNLLHIRQTDERAPVS